MLELRVVQVLDAVSVYVEHVNPVEFIIKCLLELDMCSLVSFGSYFLYVCSGLQNLCLKIGFLSLNVQLGTMIIPVTG